MKYKIGVDIYLGCDIIRNKKGRGYRWLIRLFVKDVVKRLRRELESIKSWVILSFALDAMIGLHMII